MLQVTTLSLEDRITASLTDANTCLWLPHLTEDLVKRGWQNLEEKTGITVSDYGTARIISGNAGAAQNVVSKIPIPNEIAFIEGVISIEILPKKITDSYKDSGVTFYTAEEFRSGHLTTSLKYAFSVIRQVPCLFTTVVSLVKSIHLIKPETDDYDISFSEPQIPFSIFVSVPLQNNEINALRVAEAIVHEAMHLQLTLLEQLIQFVVDSDKKYFSPWKDEYRTPQGILHALYVFRVIDYFLKTLSTYGNLSIGRMSFIQERCSIIEEQIHSIKSFKDCPALTETASNFVNRLIFMQA